MLRCPHLNNRDILHFLSLNSKNVEYLNLIANNYQCNVFNREQLLSLIISEFQLIGQRKHYPIK